jgi:hypothetical protein
MNWFKRLMVLARLLWRPRQPRLAAVQTITERELQARFLAAPGSPLWEATLTLIEQRIVTEVDQAVDPALDERAVRWKLGGLDALINLRDELREREREAREFKEEKATTDEHG